MRLGCKAVVALSLAFSAAASSQTYQPPRHTQPPPMIGIGSPMEILERADAGTEIERNRSPAEELEEHRKLDRALHALLPQRHGIIDAYVIAIALDSDAVFAR